jgi:hypothetical protein
MEDSRGDHLRAVTGVSALVYLSADPAGARHWLTILLLGLRLYSGALDVHAAAIVVGDQRRLAREACYRSLTERPNDGSIGRRDGR